MTIKRCIFSPKAVFTQQQQTSYLDSTRRWQFQALCSLCVYQLYSSLLSPSRLHHPTLPLTYMSTRQQQKWHYTNQTPLSKSLPLGPPVRLTGFQRTLMGGYVQHKSNHTAQIGQKWEKSAAITSKWLARAWWVGCTFHSSPASSFSLWTDCLQEKYPQSEEKERSRTERVSDCQKVRTGRTSVESNGGSPVTTAYKSKQGGFLAVTSADLFRQQQLANKRDFWEGITMKPVRGSTTRSVSDRGH